MAERRTPQTLYQPGLIEAWGLEVSYAINGRNDDPRYGGGRRVGGLDRIWPESHNHSPDGIPGPLVNCH